MGITRDEMMAQSLGDTPTVGGRRCREKGGRGGRARFGFCRARPAHARLAARFGAACSAALLFGARGAAAGEPVHLSYRAFGGCPTADEFFALVQARTPRAELAKPGEPAVRYDVALTPRGEAVHGSLVVAGVEGGRQTRDVGGETCGDVAQALALVVALAIDPAAVPRPEGASPPAASRPPEAKKPPPDGASAARWLVSVHLLSSTGFVNKKINLGVGVSAEWRPPWGGSWSPRARLTVLSASEEEKKGLPIAGFGVDLLAARFEGCPFALEVVRRVELSPCAGVEVGWLLVKSERALYTETSGGLWSALTAAGHVQMFPFLGKPSLDGKLVIELQGGAFAPLVDHNLVFDTPRTLVRSTPAVGAFAGLGIGTSF